MIRMAVTELETFRYWKGQEDPLTADLVADLSRKVEPTPQMQAGSALAKFFETAAAGGGDFYAVNSGEWTFDFGALDHQFQLPPFREVKGEKIYETPSGLVTLVGKVDGLDGKVVHDEKLTEKLDIERYYLDSLQWRAYLDMFGADKFVYDVFLARYQKKNDVVVGRVVEIKDYQPVPFYRYPGIEQHVRSAVVELADVIVNFLPERVKP
jgi:hypothetical protein